MADNVKELINYPEKITVAVQSISKGVRDMYAEEQVIDTVIKFEAFVDSYQFVQTEELTEAGIAVHPYGAVIVPDTANAENATLKLNYIGKEYSITNVSFNDLEAGDTFEVSQEGEEMPAKGGGVQLYGPYYFSSDEVNNIPEGVETDVGLIGITDSEANQYTIPNDNKNIKFLLSGIKGDYEDAVAIAKVIEPTYSEENSRWNTPIITIINTTGAEITEGVTMYATYYTDVELEQTEAD